MFQLLWLLVVMGQLVFWFFFKEETEDLSGKTWDACLLVPPIKGQ